MNTILPNQLRFIFKGSNGLIEGLIVYFIFYSNIKNNFTIGPLMSNERGEIILSEELVKEVISNSKNDFPMDYDGGIEDCYKLEVVVESKKELKDRVVRLEEFYPENALSLQQLLGTCSNDRTSLNQEITLPLEEETFNISVV
ncbi:MAG: hypothetical protein H6998_08680 [Hahellaceae bacterium]|jgi:hypothetical protein|nr:hypothetical protein [Hahellaceae bacterium]